MGTTLSVATPITGSTTSEGHLMPRAKIRTRLQPIAEALEHTNHARAALATIDPAQPPWGTARVAARCSRHRDHRRVAGVRAAARRPRLRLPIRAMIDAL